jgi:hypothetical protein
MLSYLSRLSPIPLAAALLLVAAPLAARAQNVPTPPALGNSASSDSSLSPGLNNNAPDPGRAHMMRAMTRERNELRQKEIVDDTQQLVSLAKQLQEAVAKSNKNELSLEVVNTAAEIEKLAKAVKDKMRDGE